MDAILLRNNTICDMKLIKIDASYVHRRSIWFLFDVIWFLRAIINESFCPGWIINEPEVNFNLTEKIIRSFSRLNTYRANLLHILFKLEQFDTHFWHFLAYMSFQFIWFSHIFGSFKCFHSILLDYFVTRLFLRNFI